MIILGSFSPVLYQKEYAVGTQQHLIKALLISTHNISRVDRKTVASRMVVFPNT